MLKVKIYLTKRCGRAQLSHAISLIENAIKQSGEEDVMLLSHTRRKQASSSGKARIFMNL